MDKHYPEDFKYLTLKLDDVPWENLFPVIEQAVKFIKEGEIVLVHCAAGVSRSSSMIIAYLMLEEGMRFKQALDFVREKRSIICPNAGFQSQLELIDELLQKKEFDYKNLAATKPAFTSKY